MTAQEKHFEVKLTRSGAGRQQKQRKTLLGLGLTRIGRVRFFRDTPAIRGMLYKVAHLVQVHAKSGQKPASARDKARAHQKGK